MIFDFWFRACQKQNSFFKSKFFFGEFSSECLVLHTGRSVGRSVRLGWQVRPDIVLTWLDWRTLLLSTFFRLIFPINSLHPLNYLHPIIKQQQQNKTKRKFPVPDRKPLFVMDFWIGTRFNQSIEFFKLGIHHHHLFLYLKISMNNHRSMMMMINNWNWSKGNRF